MYKIELTPYANIFYTEWLIDPTSSRYNLSIDQTLYGNLNANRLRDALQKYVSDHVLLNSHIQDIDEKPYWVKNDNISELEYSDTPINISTLLSYVTNSFDLHNGPLYRFKLLRIDNNIHRLILVFHHIIVDGSTSLDTGVFENISNYYNDENYTTKYSVNDQIKLITNLTNKLSVNLSQNRGQYKNFWHQQLSDIENIDLSFLRSEEDTNKQNKEALCGPKEEINFSYGDIEQNKLSKIKLKYGITPYAYSQCIFALLLHRYTGKDKIVLSYPISIKEGIDFIYASQINTNLIPYKFDQPTTIIDLFNQYLDFFKLTICDDIKYGHYPITDLIQSGGNKQLLDVCFAQTFFREHPFEFNGITKVETSTELSVDGIAEHTLMFEQNARSNGLSYRIRYDKNTTNKELLSNFAASYKKLYSEILDDLSSGNDNKPIYNYGILNSNQYHKIINEFNQTNEDYPRNKTIHQLFEEQAQKTPNNIAVVYDNAKLTYQELNTKANQLAHYLLKKHTIRQEDLVILLLDRNEYVLIAILAVLKTGAAYVPIDPRYPDARIKSILEDTKAKVVIKNTKCKLQPTGSIEISLQELLQIWTKESIDNPKTKVSPSNLAYAIYTSGTTGTPKGVMIQHRGVVNYITWLIRMYEVDYRTIGSQYSNLGFDATVIEIYPILLSGGSLIIIDEEDKLDPVKVNHSLMRHSVTYAFLPTQFAETFLELKNSSLKDLITGGDKLRKFIPQTYRVTNAYGPTEATVQSNYFIVKKQYPNIPIGKPIQNVTNYVLDKNLKPLPIGAIGELYTGGEGLTRGYVNKSDLTSEKFINNPFQNQEEKSQNKNSKLYKTGDLVRWLLDGNIEYIGRNDFQVKIRGYRVELGEIENKLLNYPDVKQAVVLVKEHKIDQDINNKNLLAYYTADKKLDETKMLDYLATQLPRYMLPHMFIYVNKLPVMASGKLDISLLPKPELTNQSEYTEVRNELERNVCEIYAKILNLPITQVGIKSDFSQMGVDSISNIRVVSRINKQLGLSISVKDISNYNNIEELVKNILTNQTIQIRSTKDIKPKVVTTVLWSDKSCIKWLQCKTTVFFTFVKNLLLKIFYT